MLGRCWGVARVFWAVAFCNLTSTSHMIWAIIHDIVAQLYSMLSYITMFCFSQLSFCWWAFATLGWFIRLLLHPKWECFSFFTKLVYFDCIICWKMALIYFQEATQSVLIEFKVWMQLELDALDLSSVAALVEFILNLFGWLEWSAVFRNVWEDPGPSVCTCRCSSQSAGKSAGGEEWPWQECRLARAPWCLRQTSSEMECTINECLRNPSVLWQTHTERVMKGSAFRNQKK